MKKRFSRHGVGILILWTLSLPAFGQSFQNLDFQQLCDTSKTGLCYWELSWGKKEAVRPDRVERKHCLLIEGEMENAVGFTEQTALAEGSGTPRILTVSAFIKPDSVIGKGAGLNIGIYDKNGSLIANRDMGGFYSLDWISGTAGWKKYAISVVCPAETAKIKIGAILYGKGKVWFKDYQVTIATLENRTPGVLATEFIQAVCDTIAEHSLVRDSINMEQLKATALKIAGPAKSYGDCYLAVNYLLEFLRPFGDEHSFFMKPEEVENWELEGSQVSQIQYPKSKIIDSCGYLLVPPFHGGNQQLILAYADSLQASIQQLYRAGIKGWLVDLRQNTGGNMAPMIAGLGPLFSSEKLGSLVDVNGKADSWYYAKGRHYWDSEPGWAVSSPVELPVRLPVAVLTAHQTGSSGEIVAISFIGNANTRSFGQPTWGLTTGNGDFDLPDGSRIFLASTVMADRNGRQYHTSIDPDHLVEAPASGESAPVITAAIKWLKGR